MSRRSALSSANLATSLSCAMFSSSLDRGIVSSTLRTSPGIIIDALRWSDGPPGAGTAIHGQCLAGNNRSLRQTEEETRVANVHRLHEPPQGNGRRDALSSLSPPVVAQESRRYGRARFHHIA